MEGPGAPVSPCVPNLGGVPENAFKEHAPKSRSLKLSLTRIDSLTYSLHRKSRVPRTLTPPENGFWGFRLVSVFKANPGGGVRLRSGRTGWSCLTAAGCSCGSTPTAPRRRCRICSAHPPFRPIRDIRHRDFPGISSPF